MKKFLLFPVILMMLLCMACGDQDRWEIRQTVKPEVLNQLGDKIAIKYNLGPFLILDDITLKNEAQAIYIFKTRDVFELDILVIYNSSGFGNSGIHYYFHESKINGSYGSKPIDLLKLQESEDEIEGFKWKEKADGSFEEPVEPQDQEIESVEEKDSKVNSSETTL